MTEPVEVPATIVTKREGTDSHLSTMPAGGLMQVVAMPWWQIVLVRVARVYAQSMLGFLTATTTGLADAVGVQIPAGDFLLHLKVAASLSVATAAITALQNVVELLGGLDTKRPTLRG